MAKKGYADVLEKDPTKGVSQEEKIGRNHQKLGADQLRGRGTPEA